MTFHVYLVAPDGGRAVIENGVTHRAASWPTREAATAYVDDCRRTRIWNSCRDRFGYEFEIVEHVELGAA